MGLDASFMTELVYYRKWWTLNDFMLREYRETNHHDPSNEDPFEIEITLEMLKKFKKELLANKNEEDNGDYINADYRKMFLNKDFKKLRKFLFKGYKIVYTASW